MMSFCAGMVQTVSSATNVVLNPATDVTETSLTLTWSKSDNVNFTSYRIMQNTVNSFSCTCKTVKIITSVSTTTWEITGLLPGVTYYFLIRVGATTGTSDSNVISVTTPKSETDTTPPLIDITSPEDGHLYTTQYIDLIWSANETVDWACYSLDGAANITLSGNATLSGFTNGTHSLTVFANDTYDNTGSATTTFNVTLNPSDVTPPLVAIDSPENATYFEQSLIVNWSADEAYSWAGYALDGGSINTVAGSPFQLDDLANGTHLLTVFANDSQMNMGSATVWFTVSLDYDPPEIMMLNSSTISAEEGARINLAAIMIDNREVTAFMMFYRFAGEDSFTRVDMSRCPTCADKYEYNMTLPTGLDTFIEYYVLASDGRNNATSPWDAPAALYNITVNARPLPVNIISPINATSGSATLTWIPSTAADFQMYSLYSSQNASLMVPVANLTSVNASSFTVSGLSANTTYYFFMRVYDSGSLYRDSALASATTLPAQEAQEAQPPYAIYAAIVGGVALVVAAAYAFMRKKAPA